jgi:hypothetical protein
MTFGYIRTDNSRRLSFEVDYDYQLAGEQSGESYTLAAGTIIRPFNTMKAGITASYSGNRDQLQYVTTETVPGGYRYILGTIDQQTLGLTLRIDYSITPELSVQYYGSPFISKGGYTEFKHVVDPENSDYNDRFALYPDPVLADGEYQLDENNDGLTDYTISDPDFNFHQFRSNFVAKWEFRPGSFLYFVWSSERTGNTADPNASLGESFGQLWDIFPDNIFLIKFNYWFSL